MAARDLMPLNSPLGASPRVVAFPVNTSATFLIGEPVQIEAAGTIIEAATDPDPATGGPVQVIGVATGSAADIAQVATGTTTVSATMLAPVYLFDYNAEFITDNLYNGSDTLVTPALAHIGDRAGLRLTAGGVWGLDIGGTDENWLITRVLDSRKTDVRVSGNTGVYAVFMRSED